MTKNYGHSDLLKRAEHHCPWTAYCFIFIISIDKLRSINSGSDTREPENIVAEVGSTVRLRCWVRVTSTSDVVLWDNYGRLNPTVYTGSTVIRGLKQRYRLFLFINFFC